MNDPPEAKPKKGLARLYETPASETPEGARREQLYFAALGRFVDRFSVAENVAHSVLRHYAKIPLGAARALLSGVRIRDVKSMLGRLTEIGLVSEADWQDLEPILQQLSIINGRRDDILHHGAHLVAEGHAIVTNAMMALTQDRITTFDISPEILDDMTADLRKIIVHLIQNHTERGMKSEAGREWAASVSREPWRYKPPPSPQKKKDSPKGKARSGQPKPSPESQ